MAVGVSENFYFKNESGGWSVREHPTDPLDPQPLHTKGKDMTTHDRAKEHMALAQAINASKRRMFDLSRDGMPLEEASRVFFDELRPRLARIVSPEVPNDLGERNDETDDRPKLAESKVQPPPEHEPGDDAEMSLMTDEQISELTGRIQRTIDTGLREMAEAIRCGADPGDAFQDVMSAFMDNTKYLPRREYDGMTHREWWDDKERRAKAIMADESGRYADSTKAAITLVYTEMKTPGNEKQTRLDWREYGDWIKRAESGEVLDITIECPDYDPSKASRDEAIERDHAAWKDQRYGSGFQALSTDDIREITSEVINGDSNAAELMILLSDEIERRAGGDSPSCDVSALTGTMADAALPYYYATSDFQREIADRQRKRFVEDEE